MKPQIACSVCHAQIAPGAASCPGCGLPLVAQAVPVMPRPRPFASIWLWILAGVIALLLLPFFLGITGYWTHP